VGGSGSRRHLGAAAGVAGADAVAALWLPLPRTSGALRLPSLAALVEVLRDRWGIPHLNQSLARVLNRVLTYACYTGG
jgi:hypothetical protein